VRDIVYNKRLAILERKVLRNIFGPVFNTKLRTFERRKNDNLYKLHGKPNIVSYLRTKRVKWFRHEWKAEGDILRKVLTETMHKKRPLGRP